jgi:hypothetical protein
MPSTMPGRHPANHSVTTMTIWTSAATTICLHGSEAGQTMVTTWMPLPIERR